MLKPAQPQQDMFPLHLLISTFQSLVKHLEANVTSFYLLTISLNLTQL